MKLSCLYIYITCLMGVYGRGMQEVTCGSVIKLYNSYYKVRLHSHDVKYGSGSGQQSVTGTPQQDDHNSNWLIKRSPKNNCSRGDPLSCGQVIRLEHLATRRNLHSHHFSSPLSDQQEISAFGEGGEGDTGDDWMVICDGDSWDRHEQVMLRHVDTDVYLGVTSQTYGRPIHGQSEIAGLNRGGTQSKWQVMEGVYITSSKLSTNEYLHDEF
ncbi:unnamed protein product [Meganyctiphanes norvegica]|uniref:MIR domain-containing protein n=1 Tax=Meganyctiphanes norvegica TaxID=48144 RepID=A0AAV2QTV7_MEGNR